MAVDRCWIYESYYSGQCCSLPALGRIYLLLDHLHLHETTASSAALFCGVEVKGEEVAILGRPPLSLLVVWIETAVTHRIATLGMIQHCSSLICDSCV